MEQNSYTEYRSTRMICSSAVLSNIAPFTTSAFDGSCIAVSAPERPNVTDAVIDAGLLALALSSMMTLAKPITVQNAPAFTKRWKAALASTSVAATLPTE
ncbi:unnamed protein product [Parnassius apollo]|uniref:(apollo) hypothetical protein n=1 Tax=Parnassius apollo TaxID=110799 RepID=A0A8S3XNS2_PARAO|nr:unnamed protein product [Parnassius apollo]